MTYISAAPPYLFETLNYEFDALDRVLSVALFRDLQQGARSMGGSRTKGWSGVCRPVFRNLPSSYNQIYLRTHFMMNSGRKLSHVSYFLPI